MSNNIFEIINLLCISQKIIEINGECENNHIVEFFEDGDGIVEKTRICINCKKIYCISCFHEYRVEGCGKSCEFMCIKCGAKENINTFDFYRTIEYFVVQICEKCWQ